MTYLMFTSRNIKRNTRKIPSRLLKILDAICLSFSEGWESPLQWQIQAWIWHCPFPRAVPEHRISFHREITTQTFIHNMSCLRSSLLGSYSIYSLMHSHLISASLFKCSFIYCGVKRKHPQPKVIAEGKEALSGFVIPAHRVSFSACL